MRRRLLIVAAMGVLLFGSLLVVSLVKPEWIEASARTLLRAEIERRVSAEIVSAQDGRIARIANRALAQPPSERRSEGLSSVVANVVTEMREGDCACRADIGRSAQDLAAERSVMLSSASGRLKQAVRATYVDTVRKLHRELRIFAGSNAVVFLLLGVVVWWRGARNALLPALVLIGGAALTGGLYLFGQNWIHTIVFDSYVGYGYIAWLGLAVGFLADIAFNRSRVTQGITNGIASGLHV